LLILLLPRKLLSRPLVFNSGLLLLGVLLTAVFAWPPPDVVPGWLAIGQPSLVLSPLLWLAAGIVSWRQPVGTITTALALLAILMVPATIAMMFSHSVNDAPAMVAHLGKLVGRIFLLIGLLQMGSVEIVRRLRGEGSLRQLNEDLDHRVHAGTAAMAVINLELTAENALRHEAEVKLQFQLDRLQLLDRITRAIGERQDMHSILQVVIRSLEDQLPIDFGCICLYDPADRVLTVSNVGIKSVPLAAELAMPETARIPVGENGLSHSIEGETVYEPDIATMNFPFPQRLARGGLRAVVTVPLMVEGDVFAVLIAARCRKDGFSSGDCNFLQQLSEHVAVAAHQAQLRDKLQKAYDELRETQKAVMQQERLRALGQMASGIAHDINNAISPMALYTDSLLSNEPNLSPRTRTHLDMVRRVVDDVQATVARMREFYRARDTQLVLLPVNLNQLVAEVVDLTRARWGDIPQRSGVVIKVRQDLQGGLPAILGIDSEIRGALTNLIFNAVDAMPDGGLLTMRTVERSSGWLYDPAPAQRAVVLEIVDTGVGMDENVRRRCLEPFFTTKGDRGTGLGLATVYGMTQRYNADIEIDSAPGQGTTFRLTFQVATAAAPVASPVANIVVPPLHILVVDDDPVILDSMRLVLEVEGHRVVTASDGKAGIEAFRAARRTPDPFAVVITDLGMPYMDGSEVARGIKQLSKTTPVILLTGWGQRSVGDHDFPAHVDRMLSKPPKLQDLREALFATLPEKPELLVFP
jgi:signal transduction histidine kinase/ActR/RegA family two-component response regulator